MPIGQTNQNENGNQRKNLTAGFWIVFIVVLLVWWGIRHFGPKLNTSWVVDAACKQVKSKVYEDYSQIPTLEGSLIYKDGEDYIVVVKYTVPEWSVEASRACHVFGYREGNCFVEHMTTEMSYDYDYEGHIEELKALWALD